MVKRLPWRPPRGYVPLDFVGFVLERDRVLRRRQSGLLRAEWTADAVLRIALFCNIDRREDAVTLELLAELQRRAHWGTRQRVLLAAVLRFTSSRRGTARVIADAIDSGELHAALVAGRIGCGIGTYQMVLNRAQIAARVFDLAEAVEERVKKQGVFDDVPAAAAFVVERMSLRKGDADRPSRELSPRFAAAETAKDFAYAGILGPEAAHRCPLGPGAREGLGLLRRQLGLELDTDEASACGQLRERLVSKVELAWMQAADVEHALCEFAKYDRFVRLGVPRSRVYSPSTLLASDQEDTKAPKLERAECTKRGSSRLHAATVARPVATVATQAKYPKRARRS